MASPPLSPGLPSPETAFRFGADIIKAEPQQDGTWILEGLASVPNRDIQGEIVEQQGLEIDYFLGRGLPPGAGGYINYDHDASIIVGYPLEGRIDRRGFWIKFRTINTEFVRRIIEQMQALKQQGWPRRYGLSIEGIVKQTDPNDPSRITRAFIRNVALTPTPVNPLTYVDFAKSLTAQSVITFDPAFHRRAAIEHWAQLAIGIRSRQIPLRNNAYFHSNGQFKSDADLRFFQEVMGLPPPDATECARYALSREPTLLKAVDVLQERLHRLHRAMTAAQSVLIPQSLGSDAANTNDAPIPLAVLQQQVRDFARRHACPHANGPWNVPTILRHFEQCEQRSPAELQAIRAILPMVAHLTP